MLTSDVIEDLFFMLRFPLEESDTWGEGKVCGGGEDLETVRRKCGFPTGKVGKGVWNRDWPLRAATSCVKARPRGRWKGRA